MGEGDRPRIELSVADATLPVNLDEPEAVWTGREVVLVGGHSEEILHFDPQRRTFTHSEATAPHRWLYDVAAVQAGSKVICCGGMASQRTVDDIFAYDPVDQSIDRPGEALPAPGRSDCGIVFDGERVYVFGGLLYMDRWGDEQLSAEILGVTPDDGRVDKLTGDRGSDVLAEPTRGAEACWTGEEALVFPIEGRPFAFDPQTETLRILRDVERPANLASVAWTGSEALMLARPRHEDPQLSFFDLARQTVFPRRRDRVEIPVDPGRRTFTLVWTGEEGFVIGGDAGTPVVRVEISRPILQGRRSPGAASDRPTRTTGSGRRQGAAPSEPEPTSPKTQQPPTGEQEEPANPPSSQSGAPPDPGMDPAADRIGEAEDPQPRSPDGPADGSDAWIELSEEPVSAKGTRTDGPAEDPADPWGAEEPNVPEEPLGETGATEEPGQGATAADTPASDATDGGGPDPEPTPAHYEPATCPTCGHEIMAPPKRPLRMTCPECDHQTILRAGGGKSG